MKCEFDYIPMDNVRNVCKYLLSDGVTTFITEHTVLYFVVYIWGLIFVSGGQAQPKDGLDTLTVATEDEEASHSSCVSPASSQGGVYSVICFC